jgi:O-antigen/teichoic acid export membrane protein
MSKIKRLAGETVLYGLGSILPRVINFALVKWHTRAFAPEEYGLVTSLYAYATFINVLYTFGMETAYFRFATKPGADEKRIFNLAQSTILAISVPISILLILFRDQVADGLASGFGIAARPEYITWFVVIMFVDALVAIPFARLRIQKKALLYALGKLINIAIVVVPTWYFLKFTYDPTVGIDVGVIFVINLVANLFYIFFFVRTLFSWRPAYDPSISPHMFSYGFPIMITGLAGMANETFSRTTLSLWLPKNFYPGKSPDYALGVFGACYKFAVLMNLVVQAFRYAAEPFFFSNATDKNSPALFARINHYFVIACCIVLLGVSINMDVIKYIFLGDKQYWEGLSIVPVLLLAYLFLGVYYNLSVWYKLTDKTYFGTILAIGGAVITIVGNYWLIPIAGYMGSSWVTLACYLLMTAMCYVLGQKYYPIPYRLGKDLAYIIVTTALVYGVTTWIKIQSEVLSFVVHQIILLAYLFLIYLLERREFRQTTA